MLLADTSAWIEFFRDTKSPACEQLDEALTTRQVATCDPVVMEILAGVRPHEVERVSQLLTSQRHLAVQARTDWLDAAEIYRSCRSEGITIRSHLDCLIAAVAIRTSLPVLHHDRDFDRIATRTRLAVAR